MIMKYVAVLSAIITMVFGQSGLSSGSLLTYMSGNSTWSNPLSLTASTSLTTMELASSPETAARSSTINSSASSPVTLASSYSVTRIASVASVIDLNSTLAVPSANLSNSAAELDASPTDAALPAPNATSIRYSGTSTVLLAASDISRISRIAVTTRNILISYVAKTDVAERTSSLHTTSTSTNKTRTAVSAGLGPSTNQDTTALSQVTGLTYGLGNSSANLPSPTAPMVWNPTIANTTNAPNNSTPVATNSSGFDFASYCDSLTASWESASLSWLRWHAASYIVTESRFEVDTLYGTVTAPTTATSCLGASRILGGQVLSVTSESETTTNITWMIMTSSEATPFPTPKPTCSVGTDDCSSLWSRYDSSMNTLTIIYDDSVTTRPTPPSCQDPRTDAYCHACTIQANEVQMYYWPLIAVGDECNADRQLLTPTPTVVGRPNTAELDGYTFTSPSVYLSFDYIYALSNTEWCGPRDMVSTIIALPPEDVSTVRFSYIAYNSSMETFIWPATTFTETDPRLDLGTYTLSGGSQVVTVDGGRYLTAIAAFPASFQDFMGAVPVDAWSSEASVANWGGSVIVDAQYSPNIAVPSMLRSLYPAWANCELYVSGVWDPPIPLQPASSVAGPSSAITTTSSSEVSVATSAEPASQPGDQRPSSTSLAVTPSTTKAKSTAPASTQRDPGASASADSDTGEDVTTKSSSKGVISVSIIVEVTDTRVSGNTSPAAGDQVPRSTTSQVDRDPASTAAQVPSPAKESDPVSGPNTVSNGVSSVRQAALPTTSVVTIGATPVALVSSGSVVIIGTQTVTSGSPPVAVNGQGVSLGSSGIVVGTTSTLLPIPAPSPVIAAATAVVGGSTVVALAQGSFAVVNSQTLVQGGSAANVAGRKVSFGSSGLVVGGSSTILTVSSPSPITASRTLVIEGSTVTAVVQGTIAIVGSQTLTLGGSSATVAGQEVTLGSAGLLLVGTSTLLSKSTKSTEVAQPGQVIDVDGGVVSIVPVDGGVLVSDGVATVKISPGNTATVLGHTIQLAAGSESVIIDGARIVSIDTRSQAAGNLVSIGGTPISISRADGAVQLTSGGRSITLDPGETAILAGHLVSVAADGESVAFDATRTVSVDAAPRAASTASKVMLLDDSPVTITRTASGLMLFDRTLSAQVAYGETVEFNGHAMSASADGTSISIDGTRTITLDSISASSASPSTTLMLGNTAISILRIGNSIVLSDGSTAIHFTAGTTITYNGHTVTLADDARSLTVDGTQIVSLSAVSTDQSAMTASDGHVWSAVLYGDVVALTDGTTSVILRPGQQVSLGASVPGVSEASAAYTTLATLSTRPDTALVTAPASLGGAVFTASSGANGAILLVGATHTTTIQPGQAVTFNGVAASAASDGSYLVIDGTRTVYLTAAPSTMNFRSSANTTRADPNPTATDGGRQAVASDPAEGGAIY
ncbi:hypothetical protein LTR95_010334 [Oleoguttula sp. CCFEE 5521]